MTTIAAQSLVWLWGQNVFVGHLFGHFKVVGANAVGL